MTTPPRRCWSFSLRTLFIVVTICAITSPAIPVVVAKYRRWSRARAIVDTLSAVEIATVPFPDDEPLTCPTAEDWKRLEARRSRWQEFRRPEAEREPGSRSQK